MVLDRPLTIERVDRVLGNRDVPAVHQLPIAADAAYPAPGARPDQLAETIEMEQIREDIAIRSGPVIEQRHLGANQDLLRLGRDRRLAVGGERHKHAPQALESEGCYESAAVPSIVHDQGLLA